MKHHRLLIFVCLLLAGELFGGETTLPTHEEGVHAHGSHPECPLPKSAQDVLKCARENHPAVRRLQLQVERAEAVPAAVSQIPNPELDVQSVWGRANGSPNMQTQISLVQPLPLSGRLGAQAKEARARTSVAQGEVGIAQAELTLQTVNHLHRLRQLSREKKIVQETLETYRKLLNQYRARPALTPEQEVSFGTLELAESDYSLKYTTLEDEEREIGHYFHVSTGHSIEELSKVLPEVPRDWPALRPDHPPSASPEIKRLQQEKEVSLAELSIARAASWPELKLGPMVMFDQEGAAKRTLYGAQVLLEVPLFQFNGAGREAASIAVNTSERSIELQRREEAHERNEQLKAYRSAVEALKRTAPIEAVTKRHRQMEKQFVRGIVPGALILEAHRQILELEKSRHERELTALRALWTVYRIDGKIMEASL